MKNLIYQNALLISEKYCTQSFVSEVRIIHNERERFLTNFWKNENIQDNQDDIRRIDMDTITILAEKKLSNEKYVDFLFEIACIALDFNDVKYAEELLMSVTTARFQFIGDNLSGYILQKLGDIQMHYCNIEQAYLYYTKSITAFHKAGNVDAIEMLDNDIKAIMLIKE